MLENTLKQRHSTHGEFTDNSKLTEDIMDLLRQSPCWNNLPAFVKVGVYMIIHKLSRAMHGDAFFYDHWKDIQGYAKCIEDRIKPNQEA